MAFKIPDSTRRIGVVGEFGRANNNIADSTGVVRKAAVFSANPFNTSDGRYGPAGGFSSIGFARYLGFVNLDLTNTASIDVSIMLATPTNPLGAVGGPTAPTAVYPYADVYRIFGDPRDTTPNLTPTSPTPDVAAKSNRIQGARIKFRYINNKNEILGDPARILDGTVIDTAPLIPGSLSPLSTFRQFYPYVVPVPVEYRTSNVSFYVYQDTAAPIDSYGFNVSGPAPTSVPYSFFVPSISTGYGWAVDKVNLGSDNGGVYEFGQSEEFIQALPTKSPSSAPTYTFFQGQSWIGWGVSFLDTKAITVDKQASYSKYFDNSFANTTGLHVSDKISFTNTSVNENRGAILNDWQYQNYNLPFRGTIGYIGKSAESIASYTGGNATLTKFNYSNETWSVLSLSPFDISIRTMASGTVLFDQFNYRKNSALPLVPQYDLDGVAGSSYFNELYTYNGYPGNAKLHGHSSTYGYEAHMTGIGGSAQPVPNLIALGYTPGEAAKFGTVPTANRIRGNVVRFPFANYVGFNEIADTSPTAVNTITWSGRNSMYMYGGLGQPAFTYPTYFSINSFAATGLTTSFKIPFATTSTVTVAPTGAGLAAVLGAAATNQDYAYVSIGLHMQATSPATVDVFPILYTPVSTDGVVIDGSTGAASTGPTDPGTSGYTRSGVRRIQRYPFAAETFTDLGDLGTYNPQTLSPISLIYAFAGTSGELGTSASETNAYVSNAFYFWNPGPVATSSVSYFGTPSGIKWAKFPFAATTSIAGETLYGGDFNYPEVVGAVADVGIQNTQSPEYSYTTRKRFAFNSETVISITTDLTMGVGASRTSYILNAPNDSISDLGYGRVVSGAINLS